MLCRKLRIAQRVAVIGNDSVKHTDNTGGIPLCKLGIMSYHNHKTVLGNLFQNIHYLNAGLGVKSTRGLISKDNIGIVNKGTGNCNTLHLSA